MDFGLKLFNAEAAQKALEARLKVAKYEKLVNYLEGKISSINGRLDEVEQNLNSQHTFFSANSESAKGLIITTFDKKESEVWKTQYETIIQNMHTGVGGLNNKKESAEQMKIYWEQQAEEWEAKIFGGF